MNYFNVQNIVIGYDTRNSSQTLLFNLASGIMASGINVIDGMVLPTSAIAYYSYVKNMVGIMITASHNSFEDNGIKIFKNGEKISNYDIDKLESLLDEEIDLDNINCGLYFKSFEPLELYENFLNSLICKNNFKLAIDNANGSLSKISERILNKINTSIIYYGNKPDGYNINTSGVMLKDGLLNIVKRNNVDYAFAYDGDGDRIILIDKTGYLYSGGEIAFILAKYFDKYNLLKYKKVVLSKTTNLGIIRAFKKEGFNVYLSDIGDTNVSLVMDNVSAVIGAEPSGHIILKDYLTTSDALLTTILLLNIFKEDPLYNYRIKKDPEIEKNYYTLFPDIVLNNFEILEFINNYKNNYLDCGKILLRKSGTEKVIRLYISNQNKSLLDICFTEIDNLINKLLES